MPFTVQVPNAATTQAVEERVARAAEIPLVAGDQDRVA